MPFPCPNVAQTASNIVVKSFHNAARHWSHARIGHRTQNTPPQHTLVVHKPLPLTLATDSSCSQAPPIKVNVIFSKKYILPFLLGVGGISGFTISAIGNIPHIRKIDQQPGQPDNTHPPLFDLPLTLMVPGTSVPTFPIEVLIGFPSLQVTSEQNSTMVPEPASSALLGLGAVAAWVIRKGRRRPPPSFIKRTDSQSGSVANGESGTVGVEARQTF